MGGLGLTVDRTGWTTTRGGPARGDDGRFGDRLGTGMLGGPGEGGTGARVEEEEDGDCSRSGIWRAHGLAAGHSGGCSDVMRLDSYPSSPFVFDGVEALRPGRVQRFGFGSESRV